MLNAGTTLGPYMILSPLGAGGMGEVYRARDSRLGRDVAIKVLPETVAADPERRRRFAQEARATAALAHPNVLVIHDVGEHEGAPFLAMELLEGETLRRRLASGPLPPARAAEVAAQIARGLAAASDKGIIHRDLKPENLFLTRDGVVKILDFGLARLTHTEPGAAEGSLANASTALTEAGQILGTMGYLAPEQVRGEPADARSDLFALGCVLYEMLSGRRAFTGASPAETLSSILRDEAPPVTGTDPLLPSVESVARRCLAKRPEERYQSAREVSSALDAVASGSVATARGRTVGPGRGRVVPALSGAALLLLLLGAAAVWQRWGPFQGWSRSPGTHAGARKDWILVAEFEGPATDSTLAPAARSLLSAALDQSEIVATVSRDQIQQALEAAGRPSNSRVNATLARELAYRSAVRAVLEGTIGRIGSGFSIVLRVVDADNAKVILTRSGTAKDEDGLIPALGDLARQLRKGLGENQQALRATRLMNLVATPSFEAYRLFAEAGRVYAERSENREAIRLVRAALAIDPDFAGAWAALSMFYWQTGQPDSARMCIDEALSRPQRLTPLEKNRIEIRRANYEGDIRGALAAYDRILSDDPENLWALGASHDLLNGLGRFEEALEVTRRWNQLAPFGPNDPSRVNEAADLSFLGRFDEAREAVRLQKGIWKNSQRGWIELRAGQPAAAESIALANLDDPVLSREAPGTFYWMLAAAQVARGSLAAAGETRKRVEEMCRAASDPMGVDALRRYRILFSVLSDRTAPLPEDVWARDTTTATLLTRGLLAAVTGDRALAKRCLESARGRPRRDLAQQGAAPVLLEARLEAMAGRPGEAVRLLRPIAMERVEPGRPGDGVGLTWVRWFLADAFEKLNQPDSAAAYIERICDRNLLPPPYADEETWAHRRLSLLYARMGRIPDAERHLAAVEKAWDRPDPGVMKLIEEARAAVAAARRETGGPGHGL